MSTAKKLKAAEQDHASAEEAVRDLEGDVHRANEAIQRLTGEIAALPQAAADIEFEQRYRGRDAMRARLEALARRLDEARGRAEGTAAALAEAQLEAARERVAKAEAGQAEADVAIRSLVEGFNRPLREALLAYSKRADALYEAKRDLANITGATQPACEIKWNDVGHDDDAPLKAVGAVLAGEAVIERQRREQLAKLHHAQQQGEAIIAAFESGERLAPPNAGLRPLMLPPNRPQPVSPENPLGRVAPETDGPASST